MLAMPAIPQIEVQAVDRPRHRRGRLLVDRIRDPALDITTIKVSVVPFPADGVAWRVARAAMAEAFGQISPTVLSRRPWTGRGETPLA